MKRLRKSYDGWCSKNDTGKVFFLDRSFTGNPSAVHTSRDGVKDSTEVVEDRTGEMCDCPGVQWL